MKVKEVEYKGCTIEIFQEDYMEDWMNPRDFDNLGTVTCFHRRITIGDEHNYQDVDDWLINMLGDKLESRFNTYHPGYLSNEEKRRAFEMLREDYIILNVYAYEHGMITINTHGFHSPWDSGQVGFIWVDKDRVREEYNWTYITRKRIKQIESYLESEIDILDKYLRGDLYHYAVDSPDGEHIGSCGGFYGDDHEKSGLLDYARGDIDSYISRIQAEALEYNEKFDAERLAAMDASNALFCGV